MSMTRRSIFNMFTNGDLSDHLTAQDAKMVAEVAAATEQYILGVDTMQFAEHLAEKYRIANVDLDLDGVSAERREAQVPAEHFPRTFHVRRGQTYAKPSFVYFVPITGNSGLLRYKPNPAILWTHKVFEEDKCLCVEFICFHDDTQRVKEAWAEFERPMATQLGHIQRQVEAHNRGIEQRASQLVESRRASVLKKYELESSLGIPIRKRRNTPRTFMVPSAKRRTPIHPRPVVTEEGFAPEPTLDMNTYREVVRTIYEFGKQLERTPSVYKGKSEEDLRDHLLLVMEPNFAGSTTGETFNRMGKTDILLRYEGSNVFVGECKWWSGQKGFSDGIDQLLSYLTWRDSKAALVIFVDRKEMSRVVETARRAVGEHRAFIGMDADGGETWLNFRLHLVEDRNRVAHVAVLLFHLPE
jgi:hypothetical protein